MDTWNTDHLYRFILADLANRASVVRNSVHHDLRYARYLLAGGYSATHKRQLQSSIMMLEAVDSSFRDNVVGRAVGFVCRAEALEQATFNIWRAEITREFRAAYSRESVLYGQLRAISDHLPPDVTVPWTRLETTDSAPLNFLNRVAETAAREACDWASGLLDLDVAAHVAVDLAHFNEVISHEARYVERSGGRRAISLHHAVQVPFHLVHLFRYSPLIVHEACHPSVRLTLSRLDEHEQNKRVEMFSREISPHIDFGRDLREREIVLQMMATEALIESVVDEMSYRIVGPGYLLAMVCWLLGRTPEAAELSLDYALPLGTRIRRLVARVLEGPMKVEGLDRFMDAIREDVAIFDKRLQGKHPEYLAFRHALLELIGHPAWLLPGMDKVGNSKDSDELRSLITDLWTGAFLAFEGAPARQKLQALGRLREGRKVAEVYGPRDDTTIEHDDTTWRVLRLHLRRASPLESSSRASDPDVGLDVTCRRIASAIAETQTESDVRTPSDVLMSRGVVGAVLGPADLIAVIPGARTREDDNVDRFLQPASEVRAYAVRRLVMRVRFVGPPDARVYDWHEKPGWQPRMFMVSDVSLNADQDTLGGPSRVTRYLTDVMAWLRSQDGVWPWAVFHGLGWSDLTLIVGLRDVGPLDALRNRVLTTDALNVQRSISHLVIFPQEIGAAHGARAATRPEGTASASSEADHGTVLRVAHRVTWAARMDELIEVLKRPLPGDIRPLAVNPTLGLHDVHVDYGLQSAEVAEQVAELDWRLQAQELVTRSVSSLVIGSALDSSPITSVPLSLRSSS